MIIDEMGKEIPLSDFALPPPTFCVSAPFGDEEKDAFCRLYAQWGSKPYCANLLGQSIFTVDKALSYDQAFKQKFDMAHELFAERVHAEVVRRAMAGVDKPIYHRGELVGYERVYSDTLLTELLKRWRPDYRTSGPNPIEGQGAVGVLVVPQVMSSEEWHRTYGQAALQQAPGASQSGERQEGAPAPQGGAETPS